MGNRANAHASKSEEERAGARHQVQAAAISPDDDSVRNLWKISHRAHHTKPNGGCRSGRLAIRAGGTSTSASSNTPPYGNFP